jgi:hypothetical protein
MLMLPSDLKPRKQAPTKANYKIKGKSNRNFKKRNKKRTSQAEAPLIDIGSL